MCIEMFLASVPVISEQEARETLVEYCTKKCCYGKRAARDMNIQTMQSTSAFHVCFHLMHSYCDILPNYMRLGSAMVRASD